MIEALAEAAGRDVSRETFARLEAFAERIRSGAAAQNLVSAATLDQLWERHILDSAQLLRFAPGQNASWVDIGSGAGLPGVVIAILGAPVTLVEPRRLRTEFLRETVAKLELGSARVVQSKVEAVSGKFDVITARAVAPLGRFLGMAHHLSHPGTVWVLPKGRNAKSELAEAQRSWQCEVEGEASRTDPDARILVLRKVRAKGKR